jgi:CHRD domain
MAAAGARTSACSNSASAPGRRPARAWRPDVEMPQVSLSRPRACWNAPVREHRRSAGFPPGKLLTRRRPFCSMFNVDNLAVLEWWEQIAPPPYSAPFRSQKGDIMGGNRLVSATFGTAALMLVAQADASEFSAKLSGFAEVPLALLSNGRGTVDLDLDKRAGTLTYKLTYSGLGSAVTQAHIHFGKIHVAGGIIVFFCSNLASPPPGTPACPPNGGTVTGTVTAGSVVGPLAQNIPPGSFAGLVAALDSDTAYANVHTVGFPAGEIRGQIRHGEADHDR